MKRTKISLLFILTLAIAVGCALWGTKASADNGSPISYHNGPVMAGTSDVYVIWYGNWVALTGPDSLDTQVILTNFLSEIGGSINFQINATYPGVNGFPSGGLIFGGTDTASTPHGVELDAAAIQSIVSENIGPTRFPFDPNGIYLVVASSDIGSSATGLCTPNAPPHHGSFTRGSQVIKYAFIGNAARCPNVAAAQFFAPGGSQLPTANGNLAADAMVTTIVRALDATVTDPFHTAWFDGFGLENADKCDGSFSHTFTTANGARANFSANGGNHKYLIQDNWVNNYGGYCSQYNDAPPRPDNQTVQVNQDTAKSITLTGVDDNGDLMSFSIVTPPQHGTLTGTGTNRTYTPAANYKGGDSFTFKANDGTLDSIAAATVSISVNTNAALDGFDPNANGLVRVAVVQPDGKILIGGDFTTLAPNGRLPVTRNYIARLNTDGTVDPTFNPSANSSIQAIALQPDGKIILGGDFSAFAPNGGASINRGNIARFNADGTIDQTLDPRGNGSVHAIAVQADGGIVIGGEFQGFNPGGGATVARNRIARLNPNGSLDMSFDPKANSTVDTLAVQLDGRILMGGRFTTVAPNGGATVTRNYVARVNVDGSLDTSFNPNPNNILGAIAIQADGRILIGGEFGTLTPNGGTSVARNHMARLKPDGTVDLTFDPSPNAFVRVIALQADGKILIGGGFIALAPNGGASATNKYLARLNADGTLDASVNPAPNDQIFAIAVQPDNKIVVGGAFFSANSFKGQMRNRLARLEIDGRLDQNLNIDAQGSSVSSSAIQRDGKIVIGGSFTSVLGVARKNLARLNTDGTLDTTFNPNANDYVNTIVVQTDGKIIVGGYFTAFAPNGGPSVTRNHVARLNSDGTIDTTFDPNANSLVFALTIQPDEKILMSGSFTALAPNGGASVPRNKLARLNSNGTIDPAFIAVPNGDVFTVALQADGKILIGGAFTAIIGSARNCIARLNTDGTVDAGFNPNANGQVYAFAVQPDSKIVVGGGFTAFAPNGGASVARNVIARLNSDGTVDNAFDPHADNFANGLTLQADGKILVVGGFSTLTPNGGAPVSRYSVARLNPDGTVDTAFDPVPDDGVGTVTLQADGKILIGGSFNSIGGQSRRLLARLANDTAAIQKLTVAPTFILWERSSAAPQLSRVTFERSSDGINYTFLGNGTRFLASSNFALTGQNLALQQNVYVRARGFYRGGDVGGSESITESVRNAFLLPAMHPIFIQQPANTVAGSTITPPVTVQIADTSDNGLDSIFAVTITLGNNPSGATLSGTKTVSAVNGLATFNDLSIDKAGSYRLTASGAIFGPTSTSSNQFTITAPAASAIAATAGSGQSATINSSFATALQATATDATGNPVSGVNVTFTAPASGASGTFANNSTTITATTNASGVATAASFTANSTAGTYAVTARVNAGSPATTFGLTNNKANQTINVTTHAPAGATVNTQFSVAAASSAGLPVSYSSSGACTNNGATFTMNSGTGICMVNYTQAGDANHNAAQPMTETVTAQKAAQTITFNPLADKIFGDSDFTVNASANSGLSISFAAAGNCTVAGNTVHINGAGSCTITASQSGSSAYSAAPDLARSFNIVKASQTITFDALSNKTFGDADFAISATASSGLTVSFAATGQCTVSASSVHINGAGACTINASQQGDSNHDAANDVLQSFQITKASTTTELSYSGSSSTEPGVTLTASVTSGAGVPNGTVTFRYDGTTIATCSDVALSSGLASCLISAISAGSHTITADYSGEANFNASTNTLTGELVSGSVFDFSLATYAVSERGGSVTITVKRTGDVAAPASVDYATDDGSVPSVAVPCSLMTGTALERCDYTRAAGTLQFAANETEKSFVVLVNDDSYAEGMETTSLNLSNPSSGAALGAQAIATLQITDDVPESSSNPVDDDATFVRQHYHDFLNREPDPDGLNFWTHNIASCDLDGCPERKLVDTSAAFFLSIEFQETGYLVERFYKVAYGDATGNSTLTGPHQLSVPIIRLREFLRDTQEIGKDVVVGHGTWQQQLEDHKQAFAQEFVLRERFTNAYPASLTAEQFINQLNANAGGVLADAEMTDLEAVFGAASAPSADAAKRAQVLRSFVEHQTLRQREFDRAFVLMQYFGYLRRNPNDAQDTDYTGYDFWLRKLDQFGGNYVNGEMVKAFISSNEYRQRFGQ